MSAVSHHQFRGATNEKLTKVRQILNKALNEIRKLQLKKHSLALSRHCSSDD